MDIIMIRHGQTQDNLKRIFSRDNTELTDRGRLEILESKKLLGGFNYDKIFYSPLTRTVQTKEVLGLGGHREDRIREIDFGIFTGKTFDGISEEYPRHTKKWMEDSINYRIPKGESVVDVYKRIEKYINELIQIDKNILLICHDCVIRTILCWVFDNPNYFHNFKVDNGSYNVVSIEDGFKYIKKTNYKHPF